MSETVLVERREGVATITLNRPDRLNALDGETVEALGDELRSIAADPSTRVVILTGAGRGFCAGGDVAGLAGRAPPAGDGSSARPRELREIMQVGELLHTMPKPTIAAVNGPCAGAGLSFACACDLRFAAASAVFVGAFLRVGSSGDHGSAWFLTRAVGPAMARELLMLGDRLDARAAHRIGLVHDVVDDDALAPHTRSVADRLAASAPTALANLKANLNDALVLPLGEYLDRETERFEEVMGSSEAREAALAYVEKRPPRF